MADTGTVRDSPSLQCQVEEIEALIRDGHKILNRVCPVGEVESKDPEAAGAAHSAKRCKRDLLALNQRLADLADALGTL